MQFFKIITYIGMKKVWFYVYILFITTESFFFKHCDLLESKYIKMQVYFEKMYIQSFKYDLHKVI